MTVRELLARVDSRELSEWMAYYRLEPWGTQVEDLRTGIVSATVANANRDPKKQRKPYSPKDFMPQWDKPGEQSPEEQLEIIKMWHALMGGELE